MQSSMMSKETSILTIYILAMCILPGLTTHSQNVGIGNPDPKATLDINGTLRIGNHQPVDSMAGVIRYYNAEFQGYDSVNMSWIPMHSLWTKGSNNGIYRPSGNVGIGTINPAAMLEVKGRIKGQRTQLDTLLVNSASGDLNARVYATETSNSHKRVICSYAKQNSTSSNYRNFGIMGGAAGAGGKGQAIGVVGWADWSTALHTQGIAGIIENTNSPDWTNYTNAPFTYDAAVLGYVNGSFTGPMYAGYFLNPNTSSYTQWGVYAQCSGATGTGTKYGLVSDVSGTASNNYGLYTSSIGGTNNYGVYASVANGSNNFAGFLDAGGSANTYALRLNGDFYNQQTNDAHQFGDTSALTFPVWSLLGNSSIVYRTGSSVIIQVFYSAIIELNKSIFLKLTRKDGSYAEHVLALAGSSSANQSPGVVSVSINWRDSGLTDGNTVIYKLYFGYTGISSNISLLSWSIIPMMLKE